MTKERVLILDFGSQVSQLIARRVRENGVYCELWPYYADLEKIRAFAPKALILSGGPDSAGEEDAPNIPAELLELGIPVLGICYGQQLICVLGGGKTEQGKSREYGRAFMEIKENSPLFEGIAEQGEGLTVWMSHGDHVSVLPKGFRVIGQSGGAPFAAIANEEAKIYGVQFHPEVVHTEKGALILKNFTHRIAGLSGDWSMGSFKEEMIAKIREKVGDKQVICGLSGGVDSSVTAALINEAIGDRLTCIFVDHGLLRAGEAEEVVKLFQEQFRMKLIFKDASALFLEHLAGVTDPEQKRKTIGRLFIEVFEEEAKNCQDAEFLAQGTLYPDVVESVSVHGGPSVTIKSHHNVGGLPERMKLKLLEPLRELFKDEVRSLGRELGLPDAMVMRHPFPGPGLAIRIIGDVTEEKLKILRAADKIYLDEIRQAGLYSEIWQAFAVLLPVKSVGVMGDGRTYEQTLALRAVTAVDGMTADIYPFDIKFLGKVAGRIVNEVKGINRVVYDITGKPPGTIEWE